jgi:hypothetical protein
MEKADIILEILFGLTDVIEHMHNQMLPCTSQDPVAMENRQHINNIFNNIKYIRSITATLETDSKK